MKQAIVRADCFVPRNDDKLKLMLRKEFTAQESDTTKAVWKTDAGKQIKFRQFIKIALQSLEGPAFEIIKFFEIN